MPADPPEEKKHYVLKAEPAKVTIRAGDVSLRATLLAAIPGKSPEESREHYARAEAAPEIRAAGYEGFIVHDEPDGEYVTLLLYERDPAEITARLTVKTENLVQIVNAVTAMIRHRKLRR